MYIEKIKLENYRNHKLLEIKEIKKINFIKGLNASGKSNLMEAILRFNSFNKKKEHLIKNGENKAVVSIDIRKGESRAKYCLVAQKEEERIIIEKRRPFGMMPIVFLDPKENSLFWLAGSNRRNFLDNSCSILKKSYKKTLAEYKRVVKQKNDYLKNISIDNNLLNTFNNQIIYKAAEIINERLVLIKKINKHIPAAYSKISLEEKKASVIYKTKINTEEIKKSLSHQIETKKEEEKRRRICLVGPHLDDIEIKIEEKNINEVGSEGEKKTACIALKVAKLKIFTEEKQRPLLILDDALSELDIKRKQLLLSMVYECEQVFITATDDLGLEIGEEIGRYELS